MSMNLRLYLMRHSVTENPDMKEDFARVLTEIGHKHAKQAAIFMENYQIDKMIVSYVKRAMQTANYIKENLEDPNIDIVEELYKNNEEVVIDLLSNQEDVNKHILVIGHNPTIYKVVMNIADPSSTEYEHLIETGMPPARIVVLDFNKIHSWEHIREEKAKIIDLFTAR